MSSERRRSLREQYLLRASSDYLAAIVLALRAGLGQDLKSL
jgi:hypothetical protein